MLKTHRARLVVFYLVALAIPVAIMLLVLSFGATSVLGDLFNYLEAERQYANSVSILIFAVKESPWALAILVFAAAPTLAALFTATLAGKSRVSRLLQRLKPIGPDHPAPAAAKTYAWLMALYLLVLGFYVLVSATSGTDDSFNRVLSNLRGPGFLAFAWILVAPFLDEGGLLEELGWRGYAQPLLQNMLRTPLNAALCLGLLWWAWHLPRELPTILGGQELAQWAQLQALFLALCIAETIVCVLCVNLCGGSVLPAMLVHGGSNVWSKAASADMYALTNTDVRTVIIVAASIWVIAKFGKQLGRKAN